MSKKSRRKRERLRQRNHVINMEPVPGVENIQRCPQCSTTVRDHQISPRICFRCSPKAADRQLKTLQEPSGATPSPSVNPSDPDHVNAAYERTELYLRASCKAGNIPVPEVFEDWRVHFMSRGSMLREWQRCITYWLKGDKMKPVTDMTPHHTLERKIKERRELTGSDGPRFQTVVQQKVANLRDFDEREKARYGIHATKPGFEKPWRPHVHTEPAIPRPSGTEGHDHHIL